MDELEDWLLLVTETCKHNSRSIERQQGLTKLIRLITKSKKLWKEYAPYYEDALQQTWMYLCRNLCEATTGDRYDPNQSNVITWLNAYLKRRLQDRRIQEQALTQKSSIYILESNQLLDSIENIPAPPDIPAILETTLEWVIQDLNGELRRIHLEGYPQINCQLLLLRRLPPETSWKTLAIELGLPISTLSSFYRRQCLPRLRKFGESEGYI